MDPTSSFDPRSAWREQLSKANPRFRLKLLLRERELSVTPFRYKSAPRFNHPASTVKQGARRRGVLS